MLYRITKKEVGECAKIFGGGCRYRFSLTTKRAGEDTDDLISSDLTISKDVFDNFSVGDEISLGLSIAPAIESPAMTDSHE